MKRWAFIKLMGSAAAVSFAAIAQCDGAMHRIGVQPTKGKLAINLTTAKGISLQNPPMLLARPDEIIK